MLISGMADAVLLQALLLHIAVISVRTKQHSGVDTCRALGDAALMRHRVCLRNSHDTGSYVK